MIKINNLIYGLYIVGIKFWAIPVFLFRASILRVFLVYFFFLLFLQHKQNFLVRAFWGSQTFLLSCLLKYLWVQIWHFSSHLHRWIRWHEVMNLTEDREMQLPWDYKIIALSLKQSCSFLFIHSHQKVKMHHIRIVNACNQMMASNSNVFHAIWSTSIYDY